MEVTARLKDKPDSAVTINYDLPTDLDALVANFGKEVVASKAIDSIVIDIQSNIRRLIRKGGAEATAEKIQEKLAQYKPSSVSTVRRTPQERMSDLLGKMSPDEQKALLKQLRDNIAAQSATSKAT